MSRKATTDKTLQEKFHSHVDQHNLVELQH